MANYKRKRGKFNWVAFSKSKKYKIIMFSGIALGLVCIAVGLLMFSQVSKSVQPRHLTLNTLSGNIAVLGGADEEYDVKLTQAETMIVLTGTGTSVLSTPITFDITGCDGMVQPIAPMYREGHVMIYPIINAEKNRSKGDLIIRCGSMTPIILHIQLYFD